MTPDRPAACRNRLEPGEYLLPFIDQGSDLSPGRCPGGGGTIRLRPEQADPDGAYLVDLTAVGDRLPCLLGVRQGHGRVPSRRGNFSLGDPQERPAPRVARRPEQV